MLRSSFTEISMHEMPLRDIFSHCSVQLSTRVPRERPSTEMGR